MDEERTRAAAERGAVVATCGTCWLRSGPLADAAAQEARASRADAEVVASRRAGSRRWDEVEVEDASFQAGPVRAGAWPGMADWDAGRYPEQPDAPVRSDAERFQAQAGEPVHWGAARWQAKVGVRARSDEACCRAGQVAWARARHWDAEFRCARSERLRAVVRKERAVELDCAWRRLSGSRRRPAA